MQKMFSGRETQAQRLERLTCMGEGGEDGPSPEQLLIEGGKKCGGCGTRLRRLAASFPADDS